MARASFTQPSFLGGEWSQQFQGRIDHPFYKQALNSCLNSLPLEEGAWTRRPGSQECAPTRNGGEGRIIRFDFAQTTPYAIELTDGVARFFSGRTLCMTNDPQRIVSISAADPAVVQTRGPHGWTSGNQVQFSFTDPKRPTNCTALRNRQFVISIIDNAHFSLVDAITGEAINGATLNFDSGDLTMYVGRILELATPYTAGSWAKVNKVQNETTVLLLHPTIKPQAVTAGFNPLTPLQPTLVNPDGSSPAAFANFTIIPAVFEDGPYLDAVNGSNLVILNGATSGSIQLAIVSRGWTSLIAYQAGDFVTYNGADYSAIRGNANVAPSSDDTIWNAEPPGGVVGPVGLQQTDVGRMVRIYSEPTDWDPHPTYTAGTSVRYLANVLTDHLVGTYYTALKTTTNEEPPRTPDSWQLTPDVAVWSWGVITSVQDQSHFTINLYGPALGFLNTVNTWQPGLWADSTSYPTCGSYQEGRFWLAGAAPNRIDSSMSNDNFVMSPTDEFGNVTDNSGISAVVEADDANPIFWLIPDQIGLICGTQSGEWVIQATSGDITPTSIVAHRVTKYGDANIPALRIGAATIFVHRYQRKLMEFMMDIFSQRFIARNLSERARHLTSAYVEEVAYQQELAPVIWARCGDGSLIGCTYKRESSFSSEPPVFFGWHRHALGSGRLVESIATGPSTDGTIDTLMMVTNDPDTNIRHVEIMTDIFDEDDVLTQAWFLDDANAPFGGVVSGSSIIFGGFSYLAGQKITAFVAGLDMGQYEVAADGTVTVPLDTNLSLDYLAEVSDSAEDWGPRSVAIANGATIYTVPAVIGFTYVSQGQLPRPELQQDTGAQNGPGPSKTRRIHRFGFLAHNAAGLSFGTGFDKLRPVRFTSPGGTLLPPTELFSGTYSDTLENDYSYDSMICWEVSRPLPATLCSVSGFIETQDR